MTYTAPRARGDREKQGVKVSSRLRLLTAKHEGTVSSSLPHRVDAPLGTRHAVFPCGPVQVPCPSIIGNIDALPTGRSR